MHKGFGCTKIEALVKLAGHNFSRPGEIDVARLECGLRDVPKPSLSVIHLRRLAAVDNEEVPTG
jgi:hypothetical protein